MLTEIAKATGMKGPGLIWAGSKIKKPDLLDRSTYLEWMDTDMLPSVMNLKGLRSALRSTARDQSEEWGVLCLMAMDDFECLGSAGFEEAIPKSSTLLPGSGEFLDYVDSDCRFYHLVSSFETGKQSTLEGTKCFLATGWDFRGDITDDEFDDWYKNVYNGQMARVDGFLRSTRYKLHHGWWSSGDGAELPCPDFLEVAEFDTTKFDIIAMMEQAINDSESWQKILSKTSFDVAAYKVEKLFGDKTLFHGYGDGK